MMYDRDMGGEFTRQELERFNQTMKKIRDKMKGRKGAPLQTAPFLPKNQNRKSAKYRGNKYLP